MEVFGAYAAENFLSERIALNASTAQEDIEQPRKTKLTCYLPIETGLNRRKASPWLYTIRVSSATLNRL